MIDLSANDDGARKLRVREFYLGRQPILDRNQALFGYELLFRNEPVGPALVTINNVPAVRQPRELLLEATYADPNGEVQSLRSVTTLWPAAVVAGIKTEGWVSASSKLSFQALALNLNGKPRESLLPLQTLPRSLRSLLLS